jgi:hypothetical protein
MKNLQSTCVSLDNTLKELQNEMEMMIMMTMTEIEGKVCNAITGNKSEKSVTFVGASPKEKNRVNTNII